MPNDKFVTAAEVGISGDEQIKIALRTMLANNGVAEMEQIYNAVEHKMKEQEYQLSRQGKASLRTFVNRDAVRAGYIEKEGSHWKITEKGKQCFEDIDEPIGDDDDLRERATYADGSTYPYDMPEEIDVREDPQTVFSWIRKLEQKKLIIDPEFQRNLVWNHAQKAKFIESVLLGIPVPPLYVNQDQEGRYIIVDGLQRTSTLWEFMHDEFELKGLEVLKKLNDFTYSQLKDLQTKFEDRKLWIYVIKPSVPLAMVYDIFHRINTGGTQLTRQEIRNCLYIGKATRLLKELAKQDYFRNAIDRGISPKRMKDREAVLRFLAFRILDYHTGYNDDMDAFLGEAMKSIQKMPQHEIDILKQTFERVMRMTKEFFGDKNFRLPTNNTRGQINIALLESISYFFASKTDSFLREHKTTILSNYERLLKEPEFIDAIRFSTGDTKRVKKRFDLAQQILGDVSC